MEHASMKKQKAITRIAALFLQECYPGDLPAHAATQGLDREWKCSARIEGMW
jgi:hypothetical protein